MTHSQKKYKHSIEQKVRNNSNKLVDDIFGAKAPGRKFRKSIHAKNFLKNDEIPLTADSIINFQSKRNVTLNPSK